MSTDQTATVTLTADALVIVKSDCRAFKADGKRYASYVELMDVTTETVPEHVAAFRDTYRTMYPKASGDEVKAYATKVRNGLKYWTGKATTSDDDADPDWITLLKQAVKNAADNGIDAATITSAVAETLAV